MQINKRAVSYAILGPPRLRLFYLVFLIFLQVEFLQVDVVCKKSMSFFSMNRKLGLELKNFRNNPNKFK